MESGDDVRIHSILASLAKSNTVIVYNLCTTVKTSSVALHDNVVYVTLPRKLYSLLSAITGWNIHYDLNPLVKLTHYIDELIVAVKLLRELEKARVALVLALCRYSFSFRES